MTMLLFVILGGHLMLLQAVIASFTTFPLDGAFDAIRLRLRAGRGDVPWSVDCLP
jgi:flagellar biosynthetic protein FliR